MIFFRQKKDKKNTHTYNHTHTHTHTSPLKKNKKMQYSRCPNDPLPSPLSLLHTFLSSFFVLPVFFQIPFARTNGHEETYCYPSLSLSLPPPPSYRRSRHKRKKIIKKNEKKNSPSPEKTHPQTPPPASFDPHPRTPSLSFRCNGASSRGGTSDVSRSACLPLVFDTARHTHSPPPAPFTPTHPCFPSLLQSVGSLVFLSLLLTVGAWMR